MQTLLLIIYTLFIIYYPNMNIQHHNLLAEYNKIISSKLSLSYYSKNNTFKLHRVQIDDY